MPDLNQRSSQRWRFRKAGSVCAAAVAIYLLLAVIPPHPFDRPRLLFHLMTAPAPREIPIPVEHVSRRALHDSWGALRSAGRRHEGIDIFAPRGTRVVAATEGLVWRLGIDPLGGRVVWVLGPGGNLHYYAHLDRYGPISVGDHVDAGDTIGTVGSTGNAQGGPPHLHYGIYARGGAINPYPLLDMARPTD